MAPAPLPLLAVSAVLLPLVALVVLASSRFAPVERFLPLPLGCLVVASSVTLRRGKAVLRLVGAVQVLPAAPAAVVAFDSELEVALAIVAARVRGQRRAPVRTWPGD